MQQLKEQEVKAKAAKTDPVIVRRLENVVKAKQSDMDEATSATSKVQKKIDAITDEIEQRTTGKIKVINKKIKDLTSILNGCRSEIMKLNVGIKTALR